MNYFQKKKLAFMSIVNKVKGFIRTITGALPLTLEGCVDEESIIDYTLYGQSVQNGTPTPETPVEVESVGEKTRNLFDINSAKSISCINPNSTIQKVDGNFVIKRTASANSMGIEFSYPFKAGEYALKIGYLTTNYSPKSAYIMYFADKSICANNSSVGYPNTVKQLNIPKDMTVRIAIYTNDNNVVGNECTFSIMLSEGYEDIPYEPYGYKIPIKVSGKNLLSPQKWVSGEHSDGIIAYPNVNYITSMGENYIEANLAAWRGVASEKFEYAKVNTVGFKINKNQVVDGYIIYYIGLQGYDVDGKKTVFKQLSTSVVADKEYVFKKNNGNFVLGLSTTSVRLCILSRSQAITGLRVYDFYSTNDAETGYEPYHEPITTNIYLDEPLRKVGDYADYVDLENGKVVRKIKKKQLTKAITLYTIGGVLGFYTDIGFLDAKYSRVKGLCNREKSFTETWVNDNGTTFWLGVNNTICYWIGILTKLGFTTLAEMNAWLKENETWVYWASKTPVEEDITLPPIPTFKGTSIISADTTVQPSNAEIEYYSNVKE